MPELPEVETVRRTLIKYVKEKTITDCQVFFNKVIKYPDNVNDFINKLIGQKINDILRRGKNLLFMLDDYVLISHLRMEGKYFFNNKEDNGDWKHILVLFELDYKYQLRYHDTRRFGTMHLYNKEEYLFLTPLNKIGLEPFDPDLTVEYLKSKWQKKNQPIKTALLNQDVIAGIGNIYANEILFACNINPLLLTRMLTDKDYYNIINETKKILFQAIKNGGTTIATYHPEPGIDGKFLQHLKVHGRAGMQCYCCSNTILKVFVNQRGTYYCPNCQKNN